MNRIYFDLSALEKWHRIEVENQLSIAALNSKSAQLAPSANECDFTISFESRTLDEPTSQLIFAKPPNHFVWSMSDRPVGLEAGLFCSLPSYLFNTKRHCSFCYFVKYNEQIQPFDTNDAKLLFSFVGGITSGVRGRLAAAIGARFGNWEFRVSGGPWMSMFDRSGNEIKKTYAESMRRTKFVLCPRGNGVGSIRMFEVLESRRVPVVISDGYVFPKGIDWPRCSVRIKERDIHKLPELLSEYEERWEVMANAARTVWEENFAPAALLDSVSRILPSLEKANWNIVNSRIVSYQAYARCRRTIPEMISRLRG